MRTFTGVVVALCLILAAPPAAHAQGTEALTVGAVKNLLDGALDDLDAQLDKASADLRSVGESFEKNARGVLADIDERLGDKLEYTLDRLEGQEQRLFESAQALAYQAQKAAEQIAAGAGEEARRTLFEGDIVAYNTSYNLPCRSHRPRLVYAQPAELVVGRDRPEVTLRGNYLNYGPRPDVRVAGRMARVIARTQEQITVEIPDAVLAGADRERSVPVSVKTGEVLRELTWFGLRCSETERAALRAQSLPVVLKPRDQVKVTAQLTPQVGTPERRTFNFSFSEDTGNSCSDRTRNHDRTWCVPDGQGWRLETFGGPSVSSRNCGSRISETRQVGDKCVFVGGRVRGCGYQNLVFGRACNGRGWLRYTMSIQAVRIQDATDGPAERFESASEDDAEQRNFLFTYGGTIADGHEITGWSYEADVVIWEAGRKRRIVVSDVNPNVEGVVSRVDETGRLDVDVSAALAR